jgi:hypothetical protein
MADNLESLLLRHIEALNPDSPEAREALFSRARASLLKNLGSQEPPVKAATVQIQLQKLEAAISRVNANRPSRLTTSATTKRKPPIRVAVLLLSVPCVMAFVLYYLINNASSPLTNTLTQEAINRCWADWTPRTIEIGASLIFGWTDFLGATYFVVQGRDVVNEVQSKQLTDSDRLNGIEWQGTLYLAPTKFQTTGAMRPWHWQDAKETALKAAYLCEQQKVRGTWQWLNTPNWTTAVLKRPILTQVPTGWQMTQQEEQEYNGLFKAEQQRQAAAAQAQAEKKPNWSASSKKPQPYTILIST